MAERELPAEDLFMTNEYSVEVTLSGSDFDPDRASSILNLTPSKSGKKGQPRESHHSSNGSANQPSSWENSFWSYEVSSRDDIQECRDHQLMCLVDDIAPHVDELRGAGMERIHFYYTLASSIGLMNIKLKSETMRRLSDLNADLYISCFDCFNPDHDYWKGTVKSGTEIE